MSGRHHVSLRWGITGAAALVLVACAPPPYQTDIDRGAWELVAVDAQGVPLQPLPRLAFNADDLTVTTGCQQVAGFAIMDSDGAMMDIGGFHGVRTTCSVPEAAAQDALLGILAETESWSVESKDRITLHGPHHTVVLERVAAASS